jgi:hypothetical protein
MFYIRGRVTDVKFNFEEGDAGYYAIITLEGERIRIISSSAPIDRSSEVVVAVGSRLHDGSFTAIACYIIDKSVFADDWDPITVFLIIIFLGSSLFALLVEPAHSDGMWGSIAALVFGGLGMYFVFCYKQFHRAKAVILSSLSPDKTGQN